MEEAAQVGDIKKPIANGHCGDRTLEFFTSIVPDAGLRGDVPAGALGIDRVEVAVSLAMLRILSNREVDRISEENSGRDDVVAGAEPSELPLGILWIQVEFP